MPVWWKDGEKSYGTWKTGAEIYKDRKGYFVLDWDVKKEEEYRKYLKSYKPDPPGPHMIYNAKTRKWKPYKKEKPKRKTRRANRQ